MNKSQNKMLIEHFEECGSISNVEAQAVYKIRSLPRRICDLKEIGYEFSRERKKDLTGQRYVRYYLIGRGD